MYSPLKVSIPEPCHEDWNKMTPVEFNQRHCQACDRVLTDFSNMTDVQIGSHLRRHEGKLCGRFHVNQLDRKLRIGGPRKLGGLRAVAAAAGLLFTVPALAQAPVSAPVEQQDNHPDPKTSGGPPRMVTINGTVAGDDDPEITLIGASVLLKGTTTGTVTDIDGKYQLKIPADRPATLIFTYTGFETTEMDFSVQDLTTAAEANNPLEGNLTVMESYGAILGGIVVISCYTHRPSLLENLMAHPVKPIYINDIPTGPAKQGDWKDYWREKFAKAKARRTERRAERALQRAARKEVMSVKPAEPPISTAKTPTAVKQADLHLTATPNPFTDHLRISFELPVPQEYTLELLSSDGKTIKSLTGKGISGLQEVELQQDIASLPSGTYFLRLITETEAGETFTLVR